MHVIIIKWWMIKVLKTSYFCATSFEINHWTVDLHCFTKVLFKPEGIRRSLNAAMQCCLAKIQCILVILQSLVRLALVIYQFLLTHWGQPTHICVSKFTIIGSDNGLSTRRRQAPIWTNVGILLIWPLGTNFDEILIVNHVSYIYDTRRRWSLYTSRWFSTLVAGPPAGTVLTTKSHKSPSFFSGEVFQ